jgi:prophage regulatory protein
MLRAKQVLEIVPISKSTLYQWIKDGKFPAPIKLSERCSVWMSESVQKFIDDYCP